MKKDMELSSTMVVSILMTNPDTGRMQLVPDHSHSSNSYKPHGIGLITSGIRDGIDLISIAIYSCCRSTVQTAPGPTRVRSGQLRSDDVTVKRLVQNAIEKKGEPRRSSCENHNELDIVESQ
ncbi:hypothetical protein AKJ16_DCAP07276, partial [Drosera capensis]